MSQPSRRTIVICLLGAAATCISLPVLSRQRPAPANDPSAISQSWAKSWSAKQLQATLDLYTPDAAFLTADGARITGKPAIRNLFQQGLDSADPQITFHSISSSSSGDLAYDSGEYDETLTFTGRAPALVATDKPVPAAGTKMQFHGNYLIVFRRQPDGRWLIAQHMWSGAPK